MVLAFSMFWLLSTPQVTEVRTEVQVEATQPPDRRAELAAEISRAQGELEQVRRVVQALPEGEEKASETKRVQALDAQIKLMRKLVAQLPDPPSNLVQPVNEAPAPTPVAVVEAGAQNDPASAESSVWIGLGFGLILGVFLAFAFAFRSLPGRQPKGSMRMPQLAVVTALLSAIGPQLLSLGYDQPLIIIGWVLLSIGAIIRLGLRRMNSQIELFSLDRVRAQVQEDEHE